MNLKENVIQETAQMSETEKMAARNTNSQYLADQIQLYDGKFEQVANKVTEVSASSTDTEYPSAKCLYDRTEPLYERDYIIEQGTSNGWTHRKWSSGIAECWGLFTGSSVSYDTGGLGYLHKVNFEYPFTFANSGTTPTAIVKFGSGVASIVTFTSSESGCSLVFDANISGADATTEYTIALEVKGRWKEEE